MSENNSSEPGTEDGAEPAADPNIVLDGAGLPKIAPAGYRSPYDQDWRVLFGLTITFLYLILMALYIDTVVSWSDFATLSVERMGSFLEGAFAPLAFLWLVIGYFLQKKELSQNTDAMKMQFFEIQKSAEQAVVQSEAIARSELHQRRESFLKLAELVRTQLGQVVGLLYLSSQMADGNEQKVPRERMAELWQVVGREDPEAFSRELLRLVTLSSEQYMYKVFFGTPIRTRHTTSFEHSFERLLRAARDCDEEDMITDALMGSGHGNVYRRIQALRENIPAGFTIGVYDFDPDSREGDAPTL
ncbi:MAG: hypothetical protein ABJ308_01125 [Halieaceae bacterium]